MAGGVVGIAGCGIGCDVGRMRRHHVRRLRRRSHRLSGLQLEPEH